MSAFDRRFWIKSSDCGHLCVVIAEMRRRYGDEGGLEGCLAIQVAAFLRPRLMVMIFQHGLSAHSVASVHDPESGALLSQVSTPTPLNMDSSRIFSQCCETMALASQKELQIISLNSNTVLHQARRRGVLRLALDPDTKHIALATSRAVFQCCVSDLGMVLWEVTLAELSVDGVHSAGAELSDMSYSPCGQTVATSFTNSLSFIGVASGSIVRKIRSRGILSLSYAPSGACISTLAVGAHGVRVEVIEIHSGNRLREVDLGDVRVDNFAFPCVAFAPCGTRLAVGSHLGIQIIQTDSGAVLQHIRVGGERTFVRCFAYSSSGRCLAIGCDELSYPRHLDSSLWLVELSESPTARCVFETVDRRITSVGFAPSYG